MKQYRHDLLHRKRLRLRDVIHQCAQKNAFPIAQCLKGQCGDIWMCIDARSIADQREQIRSLSRRRRISFGVNHMLPTPTATELTNSLVASTYFCPAKLLHLGKVIQFCTSILPPYDEGRNVHMILAS